MSGNEIIPMENQYQTRKLLSLMQRLVQIFVEVTVSLGNKNVEKERGGQYYTAMVALFLTLFDAVVSVLLLFDAVVWKLSLLMQGLVKLFSKLTASSGNKNTKK